MLDIKLYFVFDFFSIVFFLLSFIICIFCFIYENVNEDNDNYLFNIMLILVTIFSSFFVFLSSNFLIFVIFFDILVMLLLTWIVIQGVRSDKYLASFQLFFFSYLGSVIMLFFILFSFVKYYSMNLLLLKDVIVDRKMEELLFFFFFSSILTKVPIMPLHTWLLEAHVESSTTGSVILAGCILKLSAFFILKFLLPLFSFSIFFFSSFFQTFCLISFFYGFFIIFFYNDIKKIIAFSSIIHMNMAILGILCQNYFSIIGSVFSLVSHTLLSSVFFFFSGILYKRENTRNIYMLSGLQNSHPVLFKLLFLSLVINSGFPLSLSFFGEFIMLVGIFNFSFFLGSFVIFSLIFSTVFSFYFLSKLSGGINLFFDIVDNKLKSELNNTDIFLCYMLIFLIVFLGFFPNLLKIKVLL